MPGAEISVCVGIVCNGSGDIWLDPDDPDNTIVVQKHDPELSMSS